MTKRDVINIFEQEYQDALMKPEGVKEDLAEKYVDWLQDKIAQATQVMQPAPQPQEAQQNESV